MFDKWRKYSYVAQKERRHRVLRSAVWLALFFVMFWLISSLFIATVVMENRTMLPGMNPGDRFFASPFPYGAHMPLFALRLPGPSAPRRGDLVIVERSPAKVSGLDRLADSALRFFSAQRMAMSGQNASRRFIKRIVGIPGDEISMRDYVFRVKPAAEPYGLTEFELAQQAYDIAVPQPPEGWDSALPFSGSMDPVTLGDSEYFVVSDDRSAASDSRTWGAVRFESISSKIVLRYWPFSRFGRP